MLGPNKTITTLKVPKKVKTMQDFLKFLQQNGIRRTSVNSVLDPLKQNTYVDDVVIRGYKNGSKLLTK